VTASTKSNEPVNTAARIARIKGRVVVVGMVGMDLARDAFYRKELDLRLSMSYGPGRYDPEYEEGGHDYPLPHVRWTEQRNLASFLDLVAQGKVTPSKLVTHRFDIADAEQAYALFGSEEPYLGIMLTYPEASGAPTATVRLQNAPSEAAAARIGFIGAGSFAKSVLLPVLKKIPGTSLTTVATATGMSARHVAEKFGFAAASTEAAAVLQDPATDTVVIATRHDTHARFVADALRQGKNIFCEKPLAIDEAGLKMVIDAMARAHGQLVVGFNRRFSPAVVEARQALEGARPLVMLYRVNAGPLPKESWIRSREGGNRIVGEVCHFVDTLMALCGAQPERITAASARGYDDALTVQLTFTDGSIGTIIYSSLGDQSLPKERIEAFAHGRAVIIDDFRRMEIHQGGRRRTKSWSRQDKGHGALLQAFVEAIKSGAASPMRFEDIVAVTRATFEIERAILE
jgi:polar amino acid transport system substrate-binding protein